MGSAVYLLVKFFFPLKISFESGVLGRADMLLSK
jgi:hypothetical protein